MSEASRCPYCGVSLPASGGDAAGATRRNGHAPGSARPMATEHALDSLYQEVRRIREIAEARPAPARAAELPSVGPWPAQTPVGTRPAEGAAAQAAADDRRRIEELTREVQELRMTVARLRGTAVPGVVRSA